MLFPVILFLLTYVLMIVLSERRHWVALVSAIVFVVAGVLPIGEALPAIDWNILLMLFGTMGTVSFFIESRMPDKMAKGILKLAPNTMWAVILISAFAGIISAFMDNVATVLMIAPIGLAIAKELRISPVSMLICIAVSSNLQGAATLVGDTTSIMLGGYAGMDFLDFFVFRGRAGICWAVELGALATIPVIAILFRKERGKVSVQADVKVNDVVPTLFLLLNIVLLIAASFLPEKPECTNGLICTGIFLLTAFYSLLRNRNAASVVKAIKEIDYQTLILLASLFIIIRSITKAGVLDAAAQTLIRAGNQNLFLVYTIIVWGSVICSAFVDNIPFVATMLPVVSGIAAGMNCTPYVLYFGLLTGATLGGNITPIGASANIAAIGILRKDGYTVKNREFFRIGVPFTLVAVTAGYLYIWFVWRGA